MANISKVGTHYEWVTFHLSTSPNGAEEIGDGEEPTLKEAKLKVKNSLLSVGLIK